MTNSALRRARPEDVPAIEALLRAAHLPLAGLAEALDGFLVLEQGGRVVGCGGIEVHGEAALLRSLVVDPAVRGRGLGPLLTKALVAEARRRRLRRLYLFTMDASALFARYGFRPLALDEFEAAVRRSSQYQAVTTRPELRDCVRAMYMELSEAGRSGGRG